MVKKKIIRRFLSFIMYPFKREILSGIIRGWFPVFIKYPVYPTPRYGYDGKESNLYLRKIIEKEIHAYRRNLDSLLSLKNNFFSIQENQ